MKKLILSIGLVLGLAATSFAGETNVAKLFNGNELQLSLGAAVGDVGHANQWGGTIGVGYYLTENFGAEVSTTYLDGEENLFDDVTVAGLARLPLTYNIAPYVKVGASYVARDVEAWNVTAGAGVEFRLNNKWGAFGEGLFNYSEKIDENWSVRWGIRLVF